MTHLENLWKGPHQPLPVDDTWREIVRSIRGQVVEDLVAEPREFANADFIFGEEGIVIELKEVETEFAGNPAFERGFTILMERLISEDPTWRPIEYGGTGAFPGWFKKEFVRLFRPPISRILKKANLQIRETKVHFNIKSPSGVLIFVNDGFVTLEPHYIFALAAELLSTSYSSIDCFVYITVNRYVEVEGSDLANLIWQTVYSDRANDNLVNFVDSLGAKWFDYIEGKLGKFDDRVGATLNSEKIMRMNSIVLPSENIPRPFIDKI